MSTSSTDDKLRRAADNAVLLLVSRWANVLLVPISLMFGVWLVTTVQRLVTDVQDIRAKQTASIEILTQKVETVDKMLGGRVAGVERRVDRLEGIEDRRVYNQPKP